MLSAEIVDLISSAAQKVNLEPAILLALVEVEGGGKTHAVIAGKSEPLIRFEGHYFDRRLSGKKREAARRAGLAAPEPGAIRNPASQTARWKMMERAVAIDRRAAYESTSWGMGQVMGANWAWLGFDSAEALVAEARSGPEGQLKLMLRYIEKAGLMEPLRQRAWRAFARGYNGPGFAGNRYHIKLSLAYRRARKSTIEKTPSSPETGKSLVRGNRGQKVRDLQETLVALGYRIAVDGHFGPKTQKAVEQFQKWKNLIADGIAGPETSRALERALSLGRGGGIIQRTITALIRLVSGWLR